MVIELIYNALQSVLYTILLFSMMNFEWQVAKVLWFLFFIYTSFVAFTLYGMLMVALTPNPQIAAVCMGFFLSFWNLFSGFLIPRPVRKQLLTIFPSKNLFLSSNLNDLEKNH